MDKIIDLINKIDNYENTIFQNKFKSKKNNVYLVNIDNKICVLKFFLSNFKKNIKIEYNILKKGSFKLNIPYPIKFDEYNNILIMQYIDGTNLCDIINNENIIFKRKEKLIIILAKWLYNFHTFYKKSDKFKIRGDSILRNFIAHKNQIWGIDFEESKSGKPIEDIACLCSSILSTNPIFTSDKFNLCNLLIKTYEGLMDIKFDNINYHINYELLKNIQFRKENDKFKQIFVDNIKKIDFVFK